MLLTVQEPGQMRPLHLQAQFHDLKVSSREDRYDWDEGLVLPESEIDQQAIGPNDPILGHEEMSPSARRPVPVVTAESAGAFRMKYVTAGVLCQTYGLHHKQVKYLLLSVGIDTVFDKDEGHAMVFDRAQVKEASAGKDGFWVYRLAVRRERRLQKS